VSARTSSASASADPFGGGRQAARALLASLLFRVRHAWHDAPPDFATFAAGEGVRTPAEVTEHLAGLMRFAARALPAASDGGPAHDVPAASPSRAPTGSVPALADFEAACRALDAALAHGAPGDGSLAPEAMLRGPLADALTHAGQLTLLRRLAGAPVASVSYWRVPMPGPGDAEG
jgi:hypothetical protein